MIAPDILKRRALLLQGVRRFFWERNYLEVETPARLPANAPETHIEAVRSGEWFLQTSPELSMKRLLAAGSPKIFQVCKCFRGGERGRLHLPEFTMLEWYRAGIDYFGLMEECRELLQFVAGETGAGTEVRFRGRTVSLAGEWDKLPVAEAFHRYASLSVEKALAADRFDEILVTEVEPRLGTERPLFLYDYPLELGALAKPSEKRPGVAERFELYINGLELANGFSELTDAGEQRERFIRDRQGIREHGREPGPMPEAFLAALPHMPAAAGIALGFDRLVMVFLGAESIDEVVAFRPEDL